MPTIAEMRGRSKTFLSKVPIDVLIVGVVFLSATASFGLGYLAGQGSVRQGKGGFWIENVAATTTQALPAAAAAAEMNAPRIPVVSPGTTLTPTEGKYLASKNGKKYYLPTCSGAKRIKNENRLWFATLEDAQASGRTAAANCPGL